MKKREKQINNLTIFSTPRTIKRMPTTVYQVVTPDQRVLKEFSGTIDGATARQRAETYCRENTDFLRRPART